MVDQAPENVVDSMRVELETLEKRLLQASKDNAGKATKDLIIVQNRLYSQLEALSWLSRSLRLSGSLPPLRGWAASPDVLLRLHEYIRFAQPKVVVECGSGSSTLVIADALRQNGNGRLVSLEHSLEFGNKTRQLLDREGLLQWVDLRRAELEPWESSHLNDGSAETVSWYSEGALSGIQGVDLLFVDGPPGATCKFARYPALPALLERLTPEAQIWVDDTIRQEEIDICNDWAERFGYAVEFYPMEKGLGVLTPKSNLESKVASSGEPAVKDVVIDGSVLKSIESHIRLRKPAVALQFGASERTLALGRILKDAIGGSLICVAEPSAETDRLRYCIEEESLQPYLSIITSSVTSWSYQYLADCDIQLKQWFPDSVLESLASLDWLIVDGPDWEGQPCTRYPALPSVLELLSPGSEVWMLGAEDTRVGKVVAQWCEDYSVVSTPEASGRILKVRV